MTQIQSAQNCVDEFLVELIFHCQLDTSWSIVAIGRPEFSIIHITMVVVASLVIEHVKNIRTQLEIMNVTKREIMRVVQIELPV